MRVMGEIKASRRGVGYETSSGCGKDPLHQRKQWLSQKMKRGRELRARRADDDMKCRAWDTRTF